MCLLTLMDNCLWSLFVNLQSTCFLPMEDGMQVNKKVRNLLLQSLIYSGVNGNCSIPSSLLAGLLILLVLRLQSKFGLETWYKLDMTLNAMLTNEVGQKASTAQGSTLIRVGATVFPKTPALKSMRDTSLGSRVVLSTMLGLYVDFWGSQRYDNERCCFYCNKAEFGRISRRSCIVASDCFSCWIYPEKVGGLYYWRSLPNDSFAWYRAGLPWLLVF